MDTFPVKPVVGMHLLRQNGTDLDIIWSARISMVGFSCGLSTKWLTFAVTDLLQGPEFYDIWLDQFECTCPLNPFDWLTFLIPCNGPSIMVSHVHQQSSEAGAGRCQKGKGDEPGRFRPGRFCGGASARTPKSTSKSSPMWFIEHTSGWDNL